MEDEWTEAMPHASYQRTRSAVPGTSGKLLAWAKSDLTMWLDAGLCHRGQVKRARVQIPEHPCICVRGRPATRPANTGYRLKPSNAKASGPGFVSFLSFDGSPADRA